MLGLLWSYPYQSALAALPFCCMLFRHWLKRPATSNQKGLPLPPGPKGYPVIGNIFDMPVNKPWLVYEEWCKTHGEPAIIKRLLVRNAI